MWQQADTQLSALAKKVPFFTPTPEAIERLKQINNEIEEVLKPLKPL